MRRNVPSVREGVNPGAVLHPLRPRELEQGEQVVDVGVHAAVRDEPEQVHVAAARPRSLERPQERFVPRQRTVADRLVHPHEILEQDPPRPDRQVADLGVAHLALREPDRLAGSLQRPARILAPEPVEHGRVGELDGVPRPGGRAAPAVQDDERYKLDATRHIASNDAGSREAPPTSAPSTALFASSSAAFSGFTEPP